MSVALRPDQIWPPKDRPRLGFYSVAISFSGKDVVLVRKFAEAIEAELLPGEVFFDEFQQQTILGADTRSILVKTFQNYCALAVRCNSDSYDQTVWPQIEAGSIDVKQGLDPGSVLDIYFNRAPSGSFSPDASDESKFRAWVDFIVQRAKLLRANPSRNQYEVRNSHSPFIIKALIDLVKSITIARLRVVAAAKHAGFDWPVDEAAAHHHIAYWINFSRNYQDDSKLILFFQALWDLLDGAHAQLTNWFLKHSKLQLSEPAIHAAPLIRIFRWRPRNAPGGSLLELLEIQKQGNIERLQSPSEPEKLREWFAQTFPIFMSKATPETHFEFVVALDQLDGSMQNWTFDDGYGERPVAELDKVSFRIKARPMYSSCDSHWNAYSNANFSFQCINPPFLSGWENVLTQAPASAFSHLEHCCAQQKNFFVSIARSRTSIAFWRSSPNQNALPPLGDFVATGKMHSLPALIKSYRQEMRTHPSQANVVLLFENTDQPIEEPPDYGDVPQEPSS